MPVRMEEATTKRLGFSRKELSSLVLLLSIALVEYQLILVAMAVVACSAIGWFAGSTWQRGKLAPVFERLMLLEEKEGHKYPK